HSQLGSYGEARRGGPRRSIRANARTAHYGRTPTAELGRPDGDTAPRCAEHTRTVRCIDAGRGEGCSRKNIAQTAPSGNTTHTADPKGRASSFSESIPRLDRISDAYKLAARRLYSASASSSRSRAVVS